MEHAARLIATDLACRRGDRLLFRGLTFELREGEALQVTGPNGTGKSSLLRIIAGLLRPASGRVENQGSVALLDERLPVDENVTLDRALAFWSRIDRGGYGPAQRTALGLDKLGDVPVRFLSTGQRKRVAFLQSNPWITPIWLLDEPLNGLDADAAKFVQEEVAASMAHGTIAVIASHQPFEVPGLQRLDLRDFAA